jgi:hypothetical protein
MRLPVRPALLLVTAALLASAGTATAAALGNVPDESARLQAGAPPARDLDPRTITLREKFFGADNVDERGNVRRDRVILTWASVMTYAAAINGHVVLLDAWVARGEHSGYVPTDAGELAMLRPSHVFIGHGHFDHAADAAQVVAESGATLVGTPEHCDQVRAQAAREFDDTDVACIDVAPGGADPGTRSSVRALRGVEISTVTVVHSGAQPPDRSDTGGLHQPIAPPSDFSVIAEHPPSPEDVAHLAGHLGDKEGGDVVYQFRVGEFALTHHDTSGPNKELAPQVYDVLRTLPKTDVQVAAVQGFGQLTNGGRDFRLMIEALRPQQLVPGHHDNWLPGVSTRGAYYRPYVVDELQRIPASQRPVLRWLEDPADYLKPLVFDVTDARWRR